MGEELSDTDTSGHGRSAWLLFKALCWVVILIEVGNVAALVYSLFRGDVTRIVSSYVEAPAVHLTFLACFLACVAGVAGKSWAPHLARSTAVWSLSLQLVHIPMLLHMWRGDDCFGEGGRPLESAQLILLLCRFAGFMLPMVLLMVTASAVIARDHLPRGIDRGAGVLPRFSRPEHLFGAGVLLVGLALALRYEYLEPFGSWLLTVAVLLMMVGQCTYGGSFLASSALVMSVIVLVCEPSQVPICRTLEIWAPAVIIGAMAFVAEKAQKAMRVGAVALPVVLALVTCFAGHLTSARARTLIRRLAPQPVRPADFPSFLRVPEGAEVVQYASRDTHIRGEPFVLAPGVQSLGFTISEDYPAKRTLKFISGNLESAGWHKLDYWLYQPTAASSHLEGWREVSWKDGRLKGYEWSGEWIDENDQVVSAWLAYHHRAGRKRNRTSLRVHLTFSENADDVRRELERYREFRPEEVEEGASMRHPTGLTLIALATEGVVVYLDGHAFRLTVRCAGAFHWRQESSMIRPRGGLRRPMWSGVHWLGNKALLLYNRV